MLPKKQATKNGIHLVVDSTGLKVYGEGKWKVRKHGESKRCTWLKLHLGIDEATHDIEAAVVTNNDIHDSEILPEILKQITNEISQVKQLFSDKVAARTFERQIKEC